MDSTVIGKSLVHWIHLAAATTIIGGSIYAYLAVRPNLSASDEDTKSRWGAPKPWRIAVHASIFLLLVTGLVNLMWVGIPKGKEASGYHAIFGIKFLIAFVVFFLVSLAAGRSERAARLRESSPKMWIGLLLCGLLVLLLSSVLKHLG